MATITFRTVSQAILFERDLKGQISDGHWENLNVRDHYEPWCGAEVCVGQPVGRDFDVRYDKYNFTSRDLLEVVSKRMMAYVRLGMAYGRENVEALGNLLDLDGSFAGMPTYEGEYYDTVREGIAAFLADRGILLSDVRDIVERGSVYRLNHLLADLDEMKQTIRVRL